MPTATSKLLNLATAVGTHLGGVKRAIGELSQLDTVAKNTLVAAINEVVSEVEALIPLIAHIDDTTPSSDKAFSSTRIEAAIANLRDTVVGTPSVEQYDTLVEVVQWLQDDETIVAQLLVDINKLLRFDIVQDLTTEQIGIAMANIDATAAGTDMEVEYFRYSDNNKTVDPLFVRPGFFA